MRLNFWQWIGLILLIIGVVWLVWREKAGKKPPANPTGASLVATPRVSIA